MKGLKIEDYIFKLKEQMGFAISEELEEYLLKKYWDTPDDYEADLEMRYSALHDIHFFYCHEQKEKDRHFEESVDHFHYVRDNFFEEHKQAMNLLRRFGLMHLLHHPEFTKEASSEISEGDLSHILS